jgi:hypothetical protein
MNRTLETGRSRWRSVLLALSFCALGALIFAASASATHQVPIGASPARGALVPFFKPCTSTTTPPINATHGPPLAVPACHPVVPNSTTVKMGASSIGFIRIVVCPAGTTAAFCLPAGGVMPLPDDRITGSVVDVQCASTGTPSCVAIGDDYNPNGAAGFYTTPGSGTAAPLPACFPTGTSNTDCVAGTDLSVVPEIAGGVAIPAGAFTGTGARISDHYNCNNTGAPACPASSSGPDYDATTIDVLFPGAIPMDCIPTASTSTGSTCGVNTTANALVPGAVIPGKAQVVQLGQTRIKDSGPNGVRGDGDDQIFAVQGIENP